MTIGIRTAWTLAGIMAVTQTASAGKLDMTNCGSRARFCVYDGNDNMVGSGAAVAVQSRILESGERRTLTCEHNECFVTVVEPGEDCAGSDANGGGNEGDSYDVSNRFVRYRTYTGGYNTEKSSQSRNGGDHMCKREITLAFDRNEGVRWTPPPYAELSSDDWVVLDTSRDSRVTNGGGQGEHLWAERPADDLLDPVSDDPAHALRLHRADGAATDCFRDGDIVNVETESGRFVYGWSDGSVGTSQFAIYGLQPGVGGANLGPAHQWELRTGSTQCVRYFDDLELVNELFGTELIGGYTSVALTEPSSVGDYGKFQLQFYMGEGGIPFGDMK